MPYETFSKRLKELRILHKFSQKELGDKLGLSKQAISNYEKGERQSEPSYELLEKLSSLFNVSISYLIGKTNIPLNDDEINLSYNFDKSLEEIAKTNNLKMDGETPTEEEIKKMLEFIRKLMYAAKQ